MADYSFSSAATRNNRPSLYKTRNFNGESTDARESTPAGAAHRNSPSASTPAPASPVSSSLRRSKRSSKQVDESKETMSLSGRSSASGGSSKVQQYIANLNTSTWPPPKGNDSDGSDAGEPLNGRKQLDGGGPPNIWQTGKNKMSLDKGEMMRNPSSSSSNDSSASSSMSDDSDVGTRKTIDKYRKKYLDDNGGEKSNGQNAKSFNLKTSSFDSTDSDTNKESYNKYRKQLTENKAPGGKWAAPKTKLGAPPALEYNYSYTSLNGGDGGNSKPAELTAPSEAKPKLEKVTLKSNKIAKDDLGILASMLGGDDSSDSEKNEDGENSHGIFSVSPEGDGPFVDGQSSVDDDPILVKNNRNNMSDDIEESEAFEEVSVESSESSYEEEVVEDIVEEVIEEEVVEESPRVQPSKNTLVSRMTVLNNLKKAKEENERENVGSSLPSSMQRKQGYSNGAIPPNIREDRVEDEEDFGTFLDRQAPSNKGKDISEIPENVDGDDFSALWEQSVRSESRRSDKIHEDDAVTSAEQSKKPRPSSRSNAAESFRSGRAEDQSMLIENESEQLLEERGSLDRALEASDSASQHESSGIIGSSSGVVASDTSLENILPKTKTATGAKNSQLPVESDSGSDSDGSLDFDQLTGLEQYTMKDSKNSSLQFDNQAPVLSNKKVTKEEKGLQKEKKDDVRKSEQLLSVKKEDTDNSDKSLDALDLGKKPVKLPEKKMNSRVDDKSKQLLSIKKEDSDKSLDALDFGKAPVKQPEKKMSSRVDNDDDEASMGDFSFNPAHDLVEDKSQSEFEKPEYEPQRTTMSDAMDLNQAFQGLDAASLEDIENPFAKKSKTSEAASENDFDPPAPKFNPLLRKPMYPTGFVRHLGRAWALLFVLGAIGVPVYFFAVDNKMKNNSSSSSSISSRLPSLDMYPIPPTYAPTVAPVAPPTPAPIPAAPSVLAPVPTLPPVPAPNYVTPTFSPTRSRISLLREFLISVWPPLQTELIGFQSPQYFALDWLANNTNYESYSNDRLIQRFALATFYYSTSGENWRNNGLWLSNQDECTWYSGAAGSPCNANGSYTSLDLGLNDLSGTIPADLALLSNLSNLDLSRAGSITSLSSTIPSEIGLLLQLVSLSFRGNTITGFLPTEMGNLVSLTSLDLSLNNLSGAIPETIGSMTTLQSINLASNNITGQLPTSCGMLTGLKQLGLTDNNITGDIPSEIGKLSLLEGFDVDGNQFSSLPTELGNLVLLQRLSVAENSLRGILPSQIGNLISLVSLRLENNGLTGTVPTEFGRLRELKDTLDLSNNRLSGPIPSELGKLIFLRNLLLNDNQLNGTVPVAFSSLRRLAVLRLESNNLTGIVGDAVCSVFNNTYPVFVADCAPPAEIECPCCMYCCVDHGACSCQFANTELSFLCAEFSQSSGLQARMSA